MHFFQTINELIYCVGGITVERYTYVSIPTDNVDFCPLFTSNAAIKNRAYLFPEKFEDISEMCQQIGINTRYQRSIVTDLTIL